MIVKQTLTVVRLFRILLKSPSLGVKARSYDLIKKFAWLYKLFYERNELLFIIEKLKWLIRPDKKIFTSAFWNPNMFTLCIRIRILVAYSKPI